MNEDTIAQFLDTPPAPDEERQLVVRPENNGISANAESDYEISRHNIQQLIVDANTAIEGLLSVAKESQSPRAYEVLGNYLKTVADLNAQLMQLHVERMTVDEKMGKAQFGGGPTEITNNNVFVGSTEELQKYLDGRNK